MNLAIWCERPIGAPPSVHRAIKQQLRDRLCREQAATVKVERIDHREGDWLYQAYRIRFTRK